MSKDDDLKLDQLLAGGRLSGRQYDEIERRIMGEVVPRRARRWWPTLGGVAAVASALGVWVLVARSGLVAPDGGAAAPTAVDGFSAKGVEPHSGSKSSTAMFELRCATPTGACRLGDTLMFSVHAATQGGYLGAYAERVSDDAEDRIWYFPSENGAAPRLEPRAETTVLREGVRLGPPHVAGRYRVTIWVSPAPPERTAAAPPASVVPAVLAFEIVD